MTSRWVFAFTLLLPAFALHAVDAPATVPAPPVAPADAKPITFHQTADAALAVGKAEKKVTVVYFTASWCAWCRKMQVSTFPDATVTGIAPKFAWAKIDVDEEPATAAKYGVRALPHLVLLNVDGQVIASKPGYQTAANLSKFLAESADKATAPGALTDAQTAAEAFVKELKSAKDEAAASAAVRAVLAKVADTQQADREALANVLIKAGRPAWPGLAASLMDEKLAVRAAAGDLLRLATKQTLAFDPFAEKAERQTQADAWRKWVREAQTESKPEPEKAPDNEKKLGTQ